LEVRLMAIPCQAFAFSREKYSARHPALLI
jgi:hypothetical protein